MDKRQIEFVGINKIEKSLSPVMKTLYSSNKALNMPGLKSGPRRLRKPEKFRTKC